MIEADIRTKLIEVAGIERVYPIAAPQDTPLPYARINRLDTDTYLTLDGDNSLKTHIVQIDYFTSDATDCLTKLDAIRDAIEGQKFGDVHACIIEAEGTAYEFDTKLYHGFQRYEVIHT